MNALSYFHDLHHGCLLSSSPNPHFSSSCFNDSFFSTRFFAPQHFPSLLLLLIFIALSISSSVQWLLLLEMDHPPLSRSSSANNTLLHDIRTQVGKKSNQKWRKKYIKTGGISSKGRENLPEEERFLKIQANILPAFCNFFPLTLLYFLLCPLLHSVPVLWD